METTTAMNELTNMVENFCKDVTAKIEELQQKGETSPAIVLSLNYPDGDNIHNIRSVVGRRMDVLHAVSALDDTDKDGDNIIQDYLDFKAWRTRRIAHKVHRDLMRLLDEHIEELKKECEEQQTETSEG